MNRIDPRITRYQPFIYHDKQEPFPVRYLGYTIFETKGRSESFANLTIDPEKEGAAYVIEYAVYYDYDIQHLYDLEHIWVAVNEDGAVCKCWSSFHGQRLCASGVPMYRVEGTHPVLYSQPGKHAMMPDGALFGLIPDYTLDCNQRCGGGLLVPNMLKDRMHTDPQQDAMIRAFIRENYSFEPSLEYVHTPLEDSQLIPWSDLFERIPEMVMIQVERVQKNHHE